MHVQPAKCTTWDPRPHLAVATGNATGKPQGAMQGSSRGSGDKWGIGMLWTHQEEGRQRQEQMGQWRTRYWQGLPHRTKLGSLDELGSLIDKLAPHK